jgi:hypothetical protein
LHHKYDQRLFRRHIKKASVRVLTECLFSDDGVLLATSRCGAERALVEYQKTASDFGLTVGNPKTKHMAEESDKVPIAVEGGEICAVEEFAYLGSHIAASGRMDNDVERRITQASKAFGALRAVFLHRNLYQEEGVMRR